MDLRSSQRAQTQPRHEAAASAPAPHHEAAGHTGGSRRSRGGGGGLTKKKLSIIGVAVVLVGVIVAALWFTGGGAFGTINHGKYQAVFLTNGQVYFGKVSSITADVVTMKDIYYLQQQSSVQAQEDKAETPQNQLQLTKLGKELHGPEDMMFIERSQVLFWENIKDDSQVVKTIQQEKDQSKQ